MDRGTFAIQALSLVLMWVAEGTETRKQRRRDLLHTFCHLHTEDVMRLQKNRFVMIPDEDDYYDWDPIDQYNDSNHYDTWDDTTDKEDWW